MAGRTVCGGWWTPHVRGIAVIFDVVYNHLGPADLDLWKFDGWSPTGRDDEGGIYFYNDWRKKTPWGDTRPDYGRGEVRQYLRDNALRWLEERYCDGLRWDATGWIRNVWGSNNDPGSDIPDGWRMMRWIKLRDPCSSALEDHDRRGHAGQRVDHQGHRCWRRRFRRAVGRWFHAHGAQHRHRGRR